MTALRYPNLRVIAVNDRSTDATPEILRQVAAEAPQLSVVDIAELPSGWLGKNNALHKAARAATSDWLLFTDADIVFQPETLQKAVAFAAARGLAMLTSFPEMVVDNAFERMFVAYFALLLGLKHGTWAVENPRSRNHVGIGAFNLIRRDAFERIGGFEHLRLSVDDDLRLGEAMKIHGYRIKLVQGCGAMRLKWQDDLMGHIRGLEKNAFAGSNFSVASALLGCLLVTLMSVGPLVGLVFGEPHVKICGALSLAAISWLLSRLKRATGVNPLYALTAPLSVGLLVVAMLRSITLTYRRGGVVWRDHLYKLSELQQHARERSAWLNAAWKETRARGYTPPPSAG